MGGVFQRLSRRAGLDLFLNPNASAAASGIGDGGDLGFGMRRVTGLLMKVSLGSAVAWFAYQLINQLSSSRSTPNQSAAITVALLALALTVAAFVAMRQEAHLTEQTQERTERELGAEMEKAGLVSAIDEASDAVVIADRDGTVQYVNPAYTRMTGYSAHEVIGRNPQRDKSGIGQGLHRQIEEALSAGRVWRGEVANRRKDGGEYVEDMTVAPVRDSSGAVHRYIAIRRDMTARHAANEAKAFLASIVESSQDAIVSFTAAGIILSWNHAAEKLYGYAAAEVIGKHISTLSPGDQLANMKRLSDRLDGGENVGQFECVGLTKDGRRVNISVSACPIRNADGQTTARASIIRDITARVQAQEARALLASVVDAADDAILGTALDGAILSWNKGAERMYGYRASEAIGKPVSMLLPASKISGAAQILERVRHGETISQLETITETRGGAALEVSLTISPVRNGDGEVVGASAIARDITRRRRDREALHQSEEKYRWLVANLPDVVWVADESGQPVFASSNCTALSGYTLEEVCRPELWMERIHPQDQGGGRGRQPGLFRARPGDGHRVPLSTEGWAVDLDPKPGLEYPGTRWSPFPRRPAVGHHGTQAHGAEAGAPGHARCADRAAESGRL